MYDTGRNEHLNTIISFNYLPNKNNQIDRRGND